MQKWVQIEGVFPTILAEVQFHQSGEVGDAWGDTVQVILTHGELPQGSKTKKFLKKTTT